MSAPLDTVPSDTVTVDTTCWLDSPNGDRDCPLYVDPTVPNDTVPVETDAPTTEAPTTTVSAETSTVAPSTTVRECQEDDEDGCWDCTTMGNLICGPTTTVASTTVSTLPHTGATPGDVAISGGIFLALGLVIIGVLRIARRTS